MLSSSKQSDWDSAFVRWLQRSQLQCSAKLTRMTESISMGSRLLSLATADGASGRAHCVCYTASICNKGLLQII